MESSEVGLRERALEAYDEMIEAAEQKEQSAARQQQNARRRALKNNILHHFKLHVEPTEDTIVLDGLTFSVDDHQRLLWLHMPCRKCGEPLAYAAVVGGLLGLGQILKRYEANDPHQPHHCLECGEDENQHHFALPSEQTAPAPSTEQQVIIWLTALIRREVALMMGGPDV